MAAQKNNLRRALRIGLWGWLVCLTLGGSLIAVSQAQAQTLGGVTAEIAAESAEGACPGLSPCPPRGIARVLETLDEKVFTPSLEAALLSALLNLVQYVLDRVAYEAAVAIATGGEGQSELFFTQTPTEAWQNFGLDIAGEAIGQLNDVVGDALGSDFNLCAPSNPSIRLGLQLGIKQAYQPQAPKCDFRDIQENWEGFVATTLDTAADPSRVVLQEFAKGLKPGQNELSASIGLTFQVHERVLQVKTQQLAEQLSSDGFKNVTDFVTGNVKTPASVLSRQFNAQLELSREKGVDASLNAALENTNLLGVMFTQVASVFTNTLLSTLFNRIYTGLFDPQPVGNPLDAETISLGGREAAAARFSNLITANPVTISDYNALAEFVTCPSGGVSPRNINNCVLDANFASAITRAESGSALTVQEAINEGLLRGNWVLTPSSDQSRNQDPFCYTYGYCYGNLVKLRKARILPVGWEIAAERNTTGATLQEIVNAFDDCNDQGTISNSSPFCHLVDPNWVLKYPLTQCRAYVNGEILVSTISGGRAGTCVDTPSCLAEDESGSCTGGYGYCVREKNVWEFLGNSCPEQYASCLSFKNTDSGTAASYLLNTLDFSVCSGDNAGCLWYRANKYYDDGGTAGDTSDDTYEWLPSGDVFDTAQREADVAYNGTSRTGSASYTYASRSGVAQSYAVYAYEDRQYFNNNVEECSESMAGCTEVYRVGEGLSLNALANASFEEDENSDDAPDAWNWISGSETFDTAGEGYYGTNAVTIGSASGIREEGVALSPNTFYTFSFYAEAVDSGATLEASIQFFDTEGNPADFSGTSYDTDECTRVSRTGTNDAYELTADPAEWSRFECTFTTIGEPLTATVAFEPGSGGSVRVDAVALEAGESASNYSEGYNDTSPETSYLVLPPDYLNCTGASTDPAECDSYAQVCSAQDAGCSLYAPEDGDPSVPAIASSLDACPTECVGYTTYKQEATKYDDAEFPLYFIADQASACSSEYVGCDGFTNLDAVAAGGEEVEYYTDLRACLTSDAAGDDSATFFTWEGSDATGYQLMTWQLLQSDFGAGDSIDYSESAGDDDATPEDGPCVNGSVVSSDGTLSIACDDRAVESDLEDDDACNEHDDIFDDPDCREFYDADGGIHYRRFSETISVSNDCHPYRKTDSTEADCDASGGYFTDAGECAYFGLPEESVECPASADGCRAYTGGAGRNATTIFTDTFEDGDVAGFTSSGGVSLTLSNESVATGGHSMRVTAGAGDAVLTESLEDQLVAGKTYMLSFWAKGDVDLATALVEEGGAGDTDAFSDAVTLSTGWQLYEVGPLDTTDLESFDDTALLQFESETAGTFYLDNITLKAVEENITVIKNSWTVPAACDTNPAGTPSPQYYLGCEAYTDQNGDDGSFYQFSNLCSEEVVGCEAFYDTQNSESPYGEAFNVRCVNDTNGNLADEETVSSNTACIVDGETVCTITVGRSYCLFDATEALPNPLPDNVVLGPEAVLVSNDTVRYLVDNGSASCDAASMGCEEFGVPTYSQDRGEVTGFESIALINLPSSYGDVLCDNEALFCEEWSSTQDGNFYFKNPGEQACEYKTNVTIDNITYHGWFREGTDIPCDEEYLVSGEEYGIWRNGDTAFEGWAGTCGSTYDLCTQFLDPADTGEGLYPEGTSYYVINDELLNEDTLSDTQRCDGQVSQKLGCALFDDRNNAAASYATEPSYLVSNHADYFFGDEPLSLQDPVSCASGSYTITPVGTTTPVDVCAMRCAYTLPAGSDLDVGNQFKSTDGVTEFAGACVSNADCQPMGADDGETYEGTCVNVKSISEPNAVFENDSNEILKVDRDRECAAWLSCSSSQVSWNARTSKYENICTDIGLCTRASVNGDSAACTRWEEGDPVYLTDQAYANRDISWNGLEYTGYAIPDTLPVEILSQVNLKPSVASDMACWNATTASWDVSAGGQITSCEADTDCDTGLTCEYVGEDDVRLVYVAGPCDQGDVGFAGQCQTGFCADGGEACAADDDCSSGDQCVIGYCQDVTSTACTENADCSSGNVCDPVQGVCVDQLTPNGDTCVDASDCSGTNPTCTPAALSKTGACYNNQCITNVRTSESGTGFNPNSASAEECRGYPEVVSPFPSQVVETWKYRKSDGTLGDNGASHKNGQPYTMAFGFEGATTCAPVAVDEDRDGVYESYKANDDCLCSYDKVTYGDGADTRYYSRDTTDVLDGICVTGDKAGLECQEDGDCNDGGTGVGYCAKLDGQDTVFGWQGYCLEKDTSIQLFGSTSPDDRPCLNWLPVDQLAGSTDLYGKYAEAGFPLQDAFYCAEVGYYMDVGVSNGIEIQQALEDGIAHADTKIACAEFQGALGDPKEGDDSCASNVVCPSGYFAIMGAASWNKSTDKSGTYAEHCRQGFGADNDCPFICVPIDSVDEGTADVCGQPSGSAEETVGGIDVYVVSGGSEFDTIVEEYVDCALRGVQEDRDEYVFPVPSARDWSPNRQDYLACESLVQVGSTDGNAAWTDRLWEGGDDYPVDAAPYDAYLAYKYGTVNSPFGIALSPDQAEELLGVGTDQRPVPITQCRQAVGTTGGSVPYIPELAEACDSNFTVGGDDISSGITGRAYEYVTTVASDAIACDEPSDCAIYECVSSVCDGGSLAGEACSSDDECNVDVQCTICSSETDYNLFGVSCGTCVNDPPDSNLSSTDTDTTIQERLQQLFALSHELYEFDDTNGGMYDFSGEADTWAWNVTSSITPNPPTVLALGDCFGTLCEEGKEGTFTVNNQDSGTVYGAQGREHVSIAFYAYADSDRMPIRNIVVDWGDGDWQATGDAWPRDNQDGSQTDDNYYKNHRGLWSATTSWCDQFEDEWGFTASACESSYISFSHDYSCTSDDVAELTTASRFCSVDADANGVPDYSPCVQNNACTFTPRVSVKDNWGWCTGTCEGGTDGTNNCYDGSSLGEANECDWSQCPGGSSCLDVFTGGTTDPWVYYDGTIEVQPL